MALEKAELHSGAGEIAKPAGSGEWRENWATVLICMLCLGVSTFPVHSMGAMIAPIERDMGWSRAEISGGILLLSIISVIVSPFAGMAIDHFGSRRIGLPGMAIFALAIALLAASGASIWSWWGIWILLSLGTLMISPTVWAALLAPRFRVHWGLALSVMLCGGSLSAATAPIVVTALIENFGWRMAYLGLGIGIAAMMLPLIFLFVRPADANKAGMIARKAGHGAPGLTAKVIFRSMRFYKIGIAALIMASSVMGMNIHFIPILLGKGISAEAAASVASLIGIASVVGRLVTGYLLDRFPGHLVGSAVFSLSFVAVGILLAGGNGLHTGVATAIFLGLALGGEIDVIAYLTSRYFGLKSYGTIFGTYMGIITLGMGVGAALAGLAYDYTGSYTLFLSLLVPFLAAGAALIGSLGRYPVWPESGAL